MARERYLLNDDEEAINRPGAEKKADTKKSKWENFWFYHKWHIVIIAAACLLVGWFVKDMVTKVNPDYQIALLTKGTYSSNVVKSMGDAIAKYGKDLNGDGKVIVQVNSYSFSKEDITSSSALSGQSAVLSSNTASSAISSPNATSAIAANQLVQAQQADMMRFMADMASGTSIIYLTDDTNFKNQQVGNALFSYVDGTTPKEGATDYDKMRVAWSQCKVLPKLSISTEELSQSDVQKILSNLSISMRVYAVNGGTGKEYYDQSKALFNKLVYDK